MIINNINVTNSSIQGNGIPTGHVVKVIINNINVISGNIINCNNGLHECHSFDCDVGRIENLNGCNGIINIKQKRKERIEKESKRKEKKRKKGKRERQEKKRKKVPIMGTPGPVKE